MICCEDIIFYAMGPCGHNSSCWKCVLKGRLKLQNEKCAYCNEVMTTVYITDDKDDTLEKNK